MDGSGCSGIGDESQEALRELYERQFERMARFARRTLPADCRADAEDVVQGVFLEALIACLSRPSSVPGGGWLMQRLRWRIADAYRHRQREQEQLEAMALEQAQVVEDIAAERAAIQELLTAIPSLLDRSILLLKVAGYREAEIAALLSLPYEGRKVRDELQRARRQVSAWRAAQ